MLDYLFKGGCRRRNLIDYLTIRVDDLLYEDDPPSETCCGLCRANLRGGYPSSDVIALVSKMWRFMEECHMGSFSVTVGRLVEGIRGKYSTAWVGWLRLLVCV